MSTVLKTFFQDNTLTLASLGPMFIGISTGPQTLQQVTKFSELSHELNSTYPEGTLSLIVFQVSTADLRPSKEVREEMVKLSQKTKGSTLAAAIVLDGAGMGAVALRALVSAIFIATRSSYPNKVFDKIDEAVRWLLDLDKALLAPNVRAAQVNAIKSLYDDIRKL